MWNTARRRLSSRQIALTLGVSAVLVVVIMLLMAQLTAIPTSGDKPEHDAELAQDERTEQQQDEETPAEPLVEEPEPISEGEQVEPDAPGSVSPNVQHQREAVSGGHRQEAEQGQDVGQPEQTLSPGSVASLQQTASVSNQDESGEPSSRKTTSPAAHDRPHDPSPVIDPAASALEPAAAPTADDPREAGLRTRLRARLEALEETLDAREEQRRKVQSDRLAARLADAMARSIEADARAGEADRDERIAETEKVDADLARDIADDAARQRDAADLLEREFDELRSEAADAPDQLPSAYQGSSKVGDVEVEHLATAAMSVAAAQHLMSAMGESDVLYIRSLRWNGQAKKTRDLWIAMGATYALLPPQRSYGAIYRIPGELAATSSLEEVDQDDFFSRYSTRFSYLAKQGDARDVRAIESRLLRRCGECAGYRLTLVWNWQTLAVILADARALARAKGLRFPEDVQTVEWLAMPGRDARRARVDVVRLIGRGGETHAL